MTMKVHVNDSANIVSLFSEIGTRELHRGMWRWAQVMLDVPWRCWPTNQPTNQAAVLPLYRCDKNQGGTLHFVGDISAGYLESCTDTSSLPSCLRAGERVDVPYFSSKKDKSFRNINIYILSLRPITLRLPVEHSNGFISLWTQVTDVIHWSHTLTFRYSKITGDCFRHSETVGQTHWNSHYR